MVAYTSYDRLLGTTVGNYHLEQLIGQDAWGPIFLARASVAATAYLLRFLAVQINPTSKEHEVYLERFQYLASQIASLHYPYILPLLDYGSHRGIPYLVSPHIA